jgi:pimeloyl-ACP methyl ester carboxylesterase
LSRSHPVHIPADPAPLAGTLLLPDGPGPHPALIVLPGSGPVDRDGNLPGLANNGLRLLAEGLAEHGIATLRANKRGVGASHAAAPDEASLRVETYVDDTVHWMRALGGDPAIARVGLLGHSEGAVIATLAAQQAAADRLVLVAGAGSPAGPAILRQLAAGGTPPELVAAARGIIARLLRGEAVTEVPPELAGLFRSSVQPYLTSWLLRDPAAELAPVQCPVLVVQGAADLQIQVSDARLLAASRPGAGLLLVPAMNHVLKAPAEGRAANLAAYADPDLPLAAGLVEGIARFVLG